MVILNIAQVAHTDTGTLGEFVLCSTEFQTRGFNIFTDSAVHNKSLLFYVKYPKPEVSDTAESLITRFPAWGLSFL